MDDDKDIKGPVLHHAEELGQARAYDKQEAVSLFVLAILAGLWTGLTLLAIGVGYHLYTTRGFWTTFFVLAVPSGVLLGGGVVLVKGIHEQIDGLRSWREATTYAPPLPEEPEPAWRPPIPVTQFGRPTGYLAMDDRPALPSPEEARLLTPPIVAEILRASIEEYKGQWSRRKLMRLRVLGQKVTRGMYEELTSALHGAGILQQTRTGGYELPFDVECFEDLGRYLPSLPGVGDPNTLQSQPSQVSSRPSRSYNLAERHRLARLADLDHSVRCYLEKKGHNGP